MNHFSIHGTYLLTHRKRRIAKKHLNLFHKEHSNFSYKGYKLYLYKCYNDGFIAYSCRSCDGGTPITYRDAVYFRSIQMSKDLSVYF